MRPNIVPETVLKGKGVGDSGLSGGGVFAPGVLGLGDLEDMVSLVAFDEGQSQLGR
jgi:hypothetical protein